MSINFSCSSDWSMFIIYCFTHNYPVNWTLFHYTLLDQKTSVELHQAFDSLVPITEMFIAITTSSRYWTPITQNHPTVVPFHQTSSRHSAHLQYLAHRNFLCGRVESSWNVMAHGDAREEKLRGNRRMEWVVSTVHTTSEHGVSSITTADAHTSATGPRLYWRPRRFKWTCPFCRKTKSGFCACAITFQTQSTTCTVSTGTASCFCTNTSITVLEINDTKHFGYKFSKLHPPEALSTPV